MPKVPASSPTSACRSGWPKTRASSATRALTTSSTPPASSAARLRRRAVRAAGRCRAARRAQRRVRGHGDGPRLRRVRRLPLGASTTAATAEPRQDVGPRRTRCACGDLRRARLPLPPPGGPGGREGRRRLSLRAATLGDPGARAVPGPQRDRSWTSSAARGTACAGSSGARSRRPTCSARSTTSSSSSGSASSSTRRS